MIFYYLDEPVEPLEEHPDRPGWVWCRWPRVKKGRKEWLHWHEQIYATPYGRDDGLTDAMRTGAFI